MGISLTNLIIILLLVLIMFGAGKLPKVMGDIGKGIKNFKQGLKNENQDEQVLLEKDDKKNNDGNK